VSWLIFWATSKCNLLYSNWAFLHVQDFLKRFFARGDFAKTYLVSHTELGKSHIEIDGYNIWCHITNICLVTPEYVLKDHFNSNRAFNIIIYLLGYKIAFNKLHEDLAQGFNLRFLKNLVDACKFNSIRELSWLDV